MTSAYSIKGIIRLINSRSSAFRGRVYLCLQFSLPYQVCNLCGFPMLMIFLLLIRDDSAGLRLRV